MMISDGTPKGSCEEETVSFSTLEAIVPLFILVLNLLIYWQVTRHGFLNYLDESNLVNNPYVRGGISAEGVGWCIRTVEAGGWRPLAWLSHMLDVQLYGLNPGPHHLTSLFFHTVNSILLFLVLRRATGARWPSAFVAVVFAVHPLNVESVAWVSERKSVLSAFFLLSTLWSYILYSEKPSLSRYLICLLLCALGLMAGPVVKSLPLLLLILDYWPLGRLRIERKAGILREGTGLGHLLLEKMPFLALTTFSTAVTFFILRHGESPPLKIFLAKIPFLYVDCLWKILLPYPLSVLYQPVESGSVWVSAGSGLLVLGVCTMVVFLRRFPYLVTGWFWYLTTLTAAIAVGEARGWSAMADHFAYVPQIGIIIIFAWGSIRVVERLGRGRIPLSLGAGLMISVLMAISWLNLRHWQNSLVLFTHAVTVSPRNAVARNYLGFSLARERKYAEAIDHLTEALRLNSDYVEAHLNLGLVLDVQERFQESIGHFSEALRIDPRCAEAHAHWAMALSRKGLLREAAKHYFEALRINPEDAEVHNNLGVTLYGAGRFQEAMHHYSEALRIRPGYADAKRNLTSLRRFMGQIPDDHSAGRTSAH
jgi:protein O-mannosyl-transferase